MSRADDERPPKRRRVLSDAEDEPTRELQRDPLDIRGSLLELHQNMPSFSDVCVVVEGSKSSQEFACIGAVLASASRPLAAMLYGESSRMVTPSAGSSRPRLVLRGTEPWCFDLLLRYVHGLQVALDVDMALTLYHAADYYEVLPLRDGCCAFLLDAVDQANCISLLCRSQSVGCEPLETRCVELLAYDHLAAVSKRDCAFASLDPRLLERVLRRDTLVCATEEETVLALLRWYDDADLPAAGSTSHATSQSSDDRPPCVTKILRSTTHASGRKQKHSWKSASTVASYLCRTSPSKP